MKPQALIMILLLLCTAIFASEDGSNAAEYERKTRELNQLAERFKAETGFVGKISNDTNRMCLGYYEGRFADIQISAKADTVSFRLAFEQILDKVLPYTYSHRGQLSRSRITNTFGVIETAYYQQVNGYRVEGAGKLSIAYEPGRNGFAIGNGTVDISNELVQINISLDQAIQIGIQRYDPNYNFIPDNELTHPRTKLRYFPIPNEDGIEQYRLCYMVAFWGLAIFIDPSSGNIIDTKTWIIHDYHCTVDGEVYESNYSGYSVNSLGYIPIPDVFIGTDNFFGWTDNNGYVAILDSTLVNLNIKLNYQGLFSLCEYPDTIRVKTPDYINTVQDSIVVRFHDNPCNALNVYYHALNQYHSLDGLSPLSRNLFGMRIIGNMPSSMNYYGEFDPLYNAIRIREDIGQYSHVTRHELSHAFIYDKLNSAFFHNTDQSKRAMDEAFAVYLPCSVINSNLYINSPGRAHDIAHYSVSDVLVNYSQDYPNYVLNEDFYQEYFCRYPIASAWWSLRGNSLFPSSEQGVAGVDTLLVAGLKRVSREIPQNNAYRYKPRYFYNILMNQVADGSAPNSLNPKQIAIDKAYTGRGLHFTPQVESYSAANKLRNVFAPGDKVHLNISKAPQNTPFTVYVIRHDDYTYVDDANVSTLLPHLANGFSQPITGNHTDAQGMWNGLIWTIPTGLANVDGGYDIIVDFGSPNAPDNKLHFTYTAANVLDGFDGLHEPGFTVYDDGSTFVVTGSRPSSSPGNK